MVTKEGKHMLTISQAVYHKGTFHQCGNNKSKMSYDGKLRTGGHILNPIQDGLFFKPET